MLIFFNKNTLALAPWSTMFSLATALATLFLSKDPLVVVDSVVLLFVDEAAWFSSYIHSPKKIVIIIIF